MKKVVVDPVMVSKSGASLLRKDAQEALIKKLIPLAWVVTPNLMEASVLTGLKVNSLEGMKKAAHRIYKLGAKYVVVKGGHLKGMAIDLLYDGRNFHEIEGPRIETKNTHGTGCTFASAIATLLARGDTVSEAVRKAKTFITMAIQSGLSLGKGTGPTNPFCLCPEGDGAVSSDPGVKEGSGIIEGGEDWTSHSRGLLKLRLCPSTG